MAVTFFPFNSIVVDGVPDRPANAENLAAYLAGFFSNGVIMHEDTALKVEAYSGMEVQINAGMGNIKGKTILNDAAEVVTLAAASASLDRIDRVIFRLDEVNRLMEFDVLTGTPASSPVAPALTWTADVYELCLAEIRVLAGTSEILASYITDTRADIELCGTSQIPAHMQDIKHGGTGADNAAEAMLNIAGYVPSLIKLCRTADFTNISTNYNYFAPLQTLNDIATNAQSGNLTREYKTIGTYGDRTDVSVTGILVGKGINNVQVNASMGIKNASGSPVMYGLYICRERNGSTVRQSYAREVIPAGNSGSAVTNTIIPVNEGDFIYVLGYKGTASASTEISYNYNSTQLSAFAVN